MEDEPACESGFTSGPGQYDNGLLVTFDYSEDGLAGPTVRKHKRFDLILVSEKRIARARVGSKDGLMVRAEGALWVFYGDRGFGPFLTLCLGLEKHDEVGDNDTKDKPAHGRAYRAGRREWFTAGRHDDENRRDYKAKGGRLTWKRKGRDTPKLRSFPWQRGVDRSPMNYRPSQLWR